MGTHCPYCVSLKRVDAISVADGLMEMLTHTGMPVELLTVQGAIFVGKVCSELCRLLNIKHITTTAYHPQRNGALERWHGCLKGMLWKLEGSRLEQWDLLLYIACLHTELLLMLHIPFELVHGRPLQGPL